MMEFIFNNIELISTGLFALITALFGGKWMKWKKVFILIAEALEDNKITDKELKEIIKEIKDKEKI